MLIPSPLWTFYSLSSWGEFWPRYWHYQSVCHSQICHIASKYFVSENYFLPHLYSLTTLHCVRSPSEYWSISWRMWRSFIRRRSRGLWHVANSSTHVSTMFSNSSQTSLWSLPWNVSVNFCEHFEYCSCNFLVWLTVQESWMERFTRLERIVTSR